MSGPERVVWLASYPKCGNTWVRFMLFSYLYGPPKASLEVARKIPDLHRPLPVDPPEPGSAMLAKTHLMLTDRHPRLAQTERAIHVIRDPRDVALSALHYRKLGGAERLDEAGYLRSFIRAGGDPDWLAQGFGTWASHARSWRGTERFPVLAVRYEDLKADPRAELARMVAFLGEPTDEARAAEAVRASSFESMRALEIREKHQGARGAGDKRLFVGDAKATRRGVYFINKGASGQSLDGVAKGLDDAFERAFGADLAAFGYGS